jgi:tRNA-dihydrouridine synthase B
MRFGRLNLDNPLFMAPMAGITDYPFRRLVLEMGCRMVSTEMVSADGLVRKNGSFLDIGKGEHPLSVQIFGSDPEVLARAAGKAERLGADAMDINMGWRARKVTGVGAGVALMPFPEKVKKILLNVRREVKGALTIKIRAGWDQERINAVEISKIAEDCGVDAVTLHPRTRVQGFAGQADWGLIGALKKAITVPVIGNGDVTSPALAKKMLLETGCDGVMIGRGALGNPWIFSQKEEGPSPSLKERWEVIEHHFSLMQDHYGEKGALREIRKHLFWYTRGLPFSAGFRSQLPHLTEKEMLFDTLISYFDKVERHPDRSPQPPPLFEGRYHRGQEK